MYLYQTITEKASMKGDGMFNPSFAQEDINRSDRLEVWASSFEDAGGDFSIFRLMDGEIIIAEKRIEGY